MRKALFVIADLMWKPFEVRFHVVLEKMQLHRITVLEELRIWHAKSSAEERLSARNERQNAEEERVESADERKLATEERSENQKFRGLALQQLQNLEKSDGIHAQARASKSCTLILTLRYLLF